MFAGVITPLLEDAYLLVQLQAYISKDRKNATTFSLEPTSFTLDTGLSLALSGTSAEVPLQHGVHAKPGLSKQIAISETPNERSLQDQALTAQALLLIS